MKEKTRIRQMRTRQEDHKTIKTSQEMLQEQIPVQVIQVKRRRRKRKRVILLLEVQEVPRKVQKASIDVVVIILFPDVVINMIK